VNLVSVGNLTIESLDMDTEAAFLQRSAQLIKVLGVLDRRDLYSRSLTYSLLTLTWHVSSVVLHFRPSLVLVLTTGLRKDLSWGPPLHVQRLQTNLYRRWHHLLTWCQPRRVHVPMNLVLLPAMSIMPNWSHLPPLVVKFQTLSLPMYLLCHLARQ
jgi:hypothetical protein